MPFAVELYFDDALDRRVRDAWTDLGRANLPNLLTTVGARPHLSLAVADQIHTAPLLTEREPLAHRYTPVAVRLACVGTLEELKASYFSASRSIAPSSSCTRWYGPSLRRTP
jgi:hypothetical protein